jgi:acetyl-CoA decarbonylase/synthase complex subunit gamma
VLVSANYKLSFDRLRSALGATDAWIMVLDTRGINVWCAAGKGTFGTEEIIRRIEATGLDRVVSHHRLVVPQLGAPGVSAHEVRKQSGFRVIYGPVRADDLQAFLSSGMKATQEMRRVRFPFKDRVALIPMEIIPGTKYAVPVAAGFLLLAGLGPDGYSLMKLTAVGLKSATLIIGAFLAGSVIAPALLPWLPGKAFSVKGAWVGLALAAALTCYGWLRPGLFENHLAAASWALIIPALASFMAMNFTGASTYTSLSGVKREMRVAVPAQIAGAVLGTGMWIGGLFV